VKHGFARLGIVFVVFTVSSVLCEPGKCSFDDPAFGKDDKPLCVDRSQHGLQDPTKGLFDPRRKSISSVGTVRKQNFQPSKGSKLTEQEAGAIVILPTSGMNGHSPDQSQGVDGKMPFASCDLFPGVIAAIGSSFRCPNRLTVNDRHAGRGLFPHPLANLSAQGFMDLIPNTISAPSLENGVNRFPIRKLVGQIPPLTTGSIDVPDRIHDQPSTNLRTTHRRWLGQQLTDDLPLFVCQIAGIIATHRYVSVFLDLRIQ
jgi:hypothetical protein